MIRSRFDYVAPRDVTRRYDYIRDNYGRFSPQMKNHIAFMKGRGVIPRHAYMYAGSMSIANSFKLDQGTVPGCEYLEHYWNLQLLIRKQAQTEIEMMLAVGHYGRTHEQA